MSNERWTDMIVGDRMAVDREFAERITNSEFSRQEWGLIMTAVEFEIEHPADDERAALVADTSKLPQVMPEMRNIQSQMDALSGGTQETGSRGVFSSIKDALGLGGGGDDVDEERLAAAERLAGEYADELQARLESQGRWNRVRESVSE